MVHETAHIHILHGEGRGGEVEGKKGKYCNEKHGAHLNVRSSFTMLNRGALSVHCSASSKLQPKPRWFLLLFSLLGYMQSISGSVGLKKHPDCAFKLVVQEAQMQTAIARTWQ